MVAYTTDNGTEASGGTWDGPAIRTANSSPSTAAATQRKTVGLQGNPSASLSAGQRESVQSQGQPPGSMTVDSLPTRATRQFVPNGTYPDQIGGVLIPSSYFHRVATLIRNTKGEPIPEATKLFATDKFPVGADVVDSTAVLRLLRLRYSNFILLVEAKDKEADYVWYQATDTEIASNEDEAVLTFKETPVKSSGGIGISLGSDITIG